MKFANEAVTGRRAAVCVGWEGGGSGGGRPVGLAESASADSQKPSDVERGGGGGGGGCANLERLPARASTNALRRRFAKRPPSLTSHIVLRLGIKFHWQFSILPKPNCQRHASGKVCSFASRQI